MNYPFMQVGKSLWRDKFKAKSQKKEELQYKILKIRSSRVPADAAKPRGMCEICGELVGENEGRSLAKAKFWCEVVVELRLKTNP